MRYRNLGRSDLNVSEIGFGCMSLSREDRPNIQLIHEAIDLGINLFDTADLYQHGENETLLGKALQGKRNQVILTTKVGNQWKQDGSGWDWNPSKAHILKSIDQSLKRLSTDHIDLYQLHGGTIDDPINETIEAFETLKQKGKIRYYGISSIRPNTILEWVNRSKMVSVMMQYGLLDRRPEEEMIPLLASKNIGILARGTIAKGILAGKKSTDFLNYSAEQVGQLTSKINALAGSNTSPAKIAIQWCLQNPAISSAVVGIRTSLQLMDILGSDENELSGLMDSKGLAGILQPNTYDQHR